jgi:cyclophilin family peptidyl-prolyl cis-trans isomerase
LPAAGVPVLASRGTGTVQRPAGDNVRKLFGYGASGTGSTEAERFYELVRAGYYDDSRFFRVIPQRWVQFGIAGKPEPAQIWRGRTVSDDALIEHNIRGMMAFANIGLGIRSTRF